MPINTNVNTKENMLTSEKQLEQIQKMISDCANHKAHEVNAPLARIKGLANIYPKETSCSSKNELVELILENADQLSEAISAFNDLLDDCLCQKKISAYK